VRRSIRPDHLLCLVCGKPQKMLKRHLAVQHGLTPAEYRERLGLKPDYPMTAPNYAQQRREVRWRPVWGRGQLGVERRWAHSPGRLTNAGRGATSLAHHDPGRRGQG
jgi:predicted transcriptional regulator